MRPAASGNANNLLLVKARDGVPLRYFTGAGWNEERAVRRIAPPGRRYVKEFAARGARIR